MKIETFLSRPEGKNLEFKSGTNINPDTLNVRVASGLFAGFRNWKERSLLLVEVYPSALRPHWLKSQGIINGVLVRVGSTNRQTDEPLTAEMRRSALNISYDEEAMLDINPEALNFRVASGLLPGCLPGSVKPLAKALTTHRNDICQQRSPNHDTTSRRIHRRCSC